MWTKIPSLEPKIQKLLDEFVQNLPADFLTQVSEILLIGSASRGEATYRSDLDILVILRDGPLTYSRTQELRDLLDSTCFSKLRNPELEFQVQFVLLPVKKTQEHAMKEALIQAHVLIKNPEKT